ncbi:helix-turn-helix domain-containing protein [Terrihabitans rhizophilus]|uniref:Helix-turn-helix domain-containing protein n=1 Tax=Terrihabitans rhizophilus TaxID=3092662 RepID=A0ABU4RP03_9HYPH|nr:helix-turn-helix domain-containing protein [Terrihabitans sp. PJ23]MDX6806336.1 helix-turn-helix domain-containing protein [Terrihabitans sp. PJ23]
MSSTAILWARRQRIGKPHLKSLLNALATRANNDGLTFVAQATLAEDLGLSERQIRKSLALLEALGLIVRMPRSRGRKGRMSDNIILSMHRMFDVSGADIRKAKQARDAPGSTVPVERTVTSGTLLPPASNSPTGTVGSLQAEPEFRGINKEVTDLPSQGVNLSCSGVADSAHTRAAEVVPFPRRASA